jgi:type I restriction enzyme S subunit
MRSESTQVPLGSLLERIESGWSPECEPQAPGAGEWGVIRVSAVTAGFFDPTQAKRLPVQFAPRPSLEIRPEDLLMARANGASSLVGVTCIVDAAPERLLLSDKVLRLVPRPDVADPRFLNLALSSINVRRQVQLFLKRCAGCACPFFR